MTPETRAIFWARESSRKAEIEAEARRMSDMYSEQTYSEDIWFAWCVAAERQLTAQRIATDRSRAWNAAEDRWEDGYQAGYADAEGELY